MLLDGPEGAGQRIDRPEYYQRRDRQDVASALGKAEFKSSGFSLPIYNLPVGQHTLFVYVHSALSGWWYKQIGVTVTQPAFPSDNLAYLRFYKDTNYSTAWRERMNITNGDSYWSMTDVQFFDYEVFGQPPRQTWQRIPLGLDRTSLRPNESANWEIAFYGSSDVSTWVLLQSKLYSRKMYATWRWASPDGSVKSDVRYQEKVLWSYNEMAPRLP